MNGKPSQVTRIAYRVSLYGRGQDGGVVTTSMDSANLFPLWRLPAGFARFGSRPGDGGGDDWCSSFTHGWLSAAANKALLPEINDVSGEHARNLGHQTHLTGNDLDIFHLYQFDGVRAGVAGSGGLNYGKLVTATKSAMNGGAEGLRQVKEWAETTRTRLGRLIDNKNVVRIYYAAGSKVKETPGSRRGGRPPCSGRACTRSRTPRRSRWSSISASAPGTGSTTRSSGRRTSVPTTTTTST
ncbi:hypothetical protein ACFQQB_65075 [Nonomuraea rubra]|uniref:hypothetical protein n=1 Tax=Nonomuraea rubra TaxID=46180 RepID=UPI00360CD0B8